MTVTPNEGALKFLLDTEDGPVGQFVAEQAAEITAKAQANVRQYFGGAPSLNVEDDVDFEMDGSTATIGIREGGRKAQRLADAQVQGRVNWLLSAFEVEPH